MTVPKRRARRNRRIRTKVNPSRHNEEITHVSRTNQTIPVAAIREAAARPDVVTAMQRFYDQADRQIAEQTAVCWNRAECCKFGSFGHRLYVTTLEAAYYLATGDSPPDVPQDACPHAHGGKCHVRERRPLGCRVFFCDPAAQSWQGPVTEEQLARLRRLHGELGVEYIYADWIDVLFALHATPQVRT